MITRLIWTIWTLMSSVLKKADKLNLSLSLSLGPHLGSLTVPARPSAATVLTTKIDMFSFVVVAVSFISNRIQVNDTGTENHFVNTWIHMTLKHCCILPVVTKEAIRLINDLSDISQIRHLYQNCLSGLLICKTINSLMSDGTWSSLVQVMACHLFAAKPLSRPVLTCLQFQWNLNQNTMIFVEELAFEMSAKCLPFRLPLNIPECYLQPAVHLAYCTRVYITLLWILYCIT